MRFINDPMPFVIKAFKELFPGVSAEIQYVPDLGGAGLTTLPDDGGTPLIDISIDIPISALPEILSHELAHIVNPDDEHGEKWKKTHDLIFKRAQELYDLDYQEFKKERYPLGVVRF